MKEPAERVVEELLVMACQDGKPEALDMLVGRWQKRLWLHARRLTGSADGAWEVTQESWLAIIKGINKLNDPARFVTWAYRIVTNKSIDRLKKRKVTTSVDPVILGRQVPDGRAPQDDSPEVEALMAVLPAEKKVVLTLYYIDEFGVSEIAEILNIPTGTVKSRLHSGRSALRELWQRRFPKKQETRDE